MDTVRNGGRLAVFVLLTACAAAGISPVAAAVLEVDAAGGTPYQTITSAVNGAIPGEDSVFVHCGTYNETFSMRDGVSVRGEDAGCTVIDGGQTGSVVSFIGLNAGTVLEGFTITNGHSELGGGIFVEASSATIMGNIISDNTAFSTGFGTGSGGGIHVTTPLKSVLAATAPVITHNVIRNNVADSFGGGIALYIDDGATILNNLIENNTAGEAGGGIDTFSSFPTIIGNTIVRNCLQSAGSACRVGGGGIALTQSGVSDIQWNVIAENEAAVGGGGVDVESSTINLIANDAFGNQPVNYSGVTDPTGTDGNLSVDPQFVDPAGGNYRLSAASPLLDAVAFSTDVFACLDLDGLPRVMEQDGDGAVERDLGAYERMLASVSEVTNLQFPTNMMLEWDPTTATGFNIYRDLLSSLSRTNLGACFDSVTSTTLVDRSIPNSGDGFFYLVTAVDALAEGSLGFVECEERSNFAPCLP